MAKEFLSRKGVPYTEKNVQRDASAAQEMLRRSGHNGVPQILVGDQLVIGFDRPRIEALLAQASAAQAAPTGVSLGGRVADAIVHAPQARDGAYVGNVKPGSVAQQAGIQAGDVIIAIDGQPVRTADDLIRAGKRLSHGQSIPLTIVREGQHRELTLQS